MTTIYVMTDIEGVAGVESFIYQSHIESKYYQQSMRLLTAEVNAAVEGLCQAGIDRIIVGDGHGTGGIDYESLHPRAEVVIGRPITITQLLEPIPLCDAVAMIGQHAMAGVATGNQNHTQCDRTIDWMKINGKLIGEIAQFALYVGSYGKPLYFLSGDQAACEEVEQLIPGVSTIAVKKGLGRQCSLCLSPTESRRRIQEGISKAVTNHLANPVIPLVWEGPYVLEKRFFHTDVADRAAEYRGVERIDSQTVRVHGDDIREMAYFSM